MKYVYYYDYTILKIGIAEDDDAICRIFFESENEPEDYKKTETPLIKIAALRIGEYIKGKRKRFDLPVKMDGTEFQLTVWKALQEIPYGETRSYAQIAEMTGNPKSSRAVGMANNRNPIPIIIPCHRVIGSDGDLTGYAGGLEIKKKLLELEKKFNR